MPAFDTIAAAVAARFAPAQVTAPAGETNIRSASAQPPNELSALPCVLVFADVGAFATGNGTRTGAHTFLVRFYLAQSIDLERESGRLLKWLAVLCDQLRISAQLAGLVDRAVVESWRIGAMRYGGADYSGIELRVEIVTSEGWQAVA